MIMQGIFLFIVSEKKKKDFATAASDEQRRELFYKPF
jgi:hypothetical protein